MTDEALRKGKSTQLYIWDFTLSADCVDNWEALYDMIKEYVKKYGIQLEQGTKTGFKHWQGRISLIKKKRLTEVQKILPQAHWSITNNEAKDNIYLYTTKADTRLEGPYRDDEEPKIITRQLKQFMNYELYPYQKQLIEEAQNYNDRFIDVIYDTEGNLGKSIFSEYLEHKDLAEEVPPFRSMEDIFQWVYGRPKKKVYIFDMPRGMKKDKLGDFYAGIEVIKNGVAYDKRYTAKKTRFDRPRIFVFTNTLPVFELLSKDRWQVWEVKDKTLHKYLEYNSSDEE